MKQFLTVFTLAMIALCITSCGNKSKSESNFTTTSTGVGPIQLGLAVGGIPASFAGLYDSFTTEKIIDEMDGNYSVLHFILSGTTVVNANIYFEDKIGTIEILGENISSEDGVHPGTTVQELFDKGAEGQMMNNGEFTVKLGDIGYQVSGLTEAGEKKLEVGYLTGDLEPVTAQDFKSDAKVTGFFIY